MSKEKQSYKEAKAVIIGETFTSLLDPLTLDTPCLLLPICGIPIIELILNSLSSIKEVFICINRYKTEIENYLKKYHKQLSYKLIYSQDFKNVGDCLRQIKQDNDIEELFNIHIKNKSRDNNCMITSVMKRYKTTNEIKTNYDENILIYNENDKRIFQFEPTYNKTKVEIFKGIISKENRNNNFRERSDLFETGVDICSPKFLEQMTEKEKFDLQSVKDTIGQILSDEIYEDTFYLQELNEDSYCGLIRNVESYLKVNFEILNRWAYPIVIDNIDMSNKLEINLKQLKLSLYSDKETNSENFRKAELFKEVVILNKENIVGKESKLKKCVLCKNVQIGQKCELDNCIIFPGTIVENDVIIKNSIIGKDCQIKSGIKIISSILGTNIALDKDSIKKRIYKENEQIIEINNNEFIQKLEKHERLYLSTKSQLGFNDTNLVLDKEEDKDENEFYSDEESEQSYKEESFAEGVEYILSSGLEKNKEKKDLVNEIWNLRNDNVSNPTEEETLKICLSYILKQYLNGKKFVGNKKTAKELINLFNDWKPLFKKFVIDDNIELKLVSVLEQICIEIKEMNSAFHIIIKILNGQCHLIKDETLINWNEKLESSFETNEETIIIPEDINKKNKKDMKDYINDLQNNGDEEEEEEEDDDEK